MESYIRLLFINDKAVEEMIHPDDEDNDSGFITSAKIEGIKIFAVYQIALDNLMNSQLRRPE